MEPSEESSPPRAYLAIPVGVLLLVALWEIVATLRAPRGVPDDSAWRAAAAEVRKQFQAGDLIVFAPDWIEPVGRLHLGDLMPLDDVARMDHAKYRRIWELSIRGAASPVADVPAIARTQVSGIESGIESVEIVRREQTPAVVLADLRERLPTAKIEGGRATLVLAEVGFAPHRCIQAMPGSRITFPALPLGSQLVGYVGIADVFTRRDVRAPGELDVQIGGTVVASAIAGVDDGWVRFAAPTTPGTSDVTIVVRSSAPGRLICFAAEARQ